MNLVLQPCHLLLLILAGWMNRDQQEAIDYLLTEIAILKEHCGKNRILLTDDQRRRLTVKGKVLGRKRMQEVTALFTPDTILRWHRQLVAKKWDYSDRQEKRQGRPRVRQAIVDLVVKFAKENPSWGCDRIQGALANVGYEISDTTVENILKGQGIEPAPKRKRTGSWETFLKAHWDVLASVDFTTVEVWTKSGPTTFYLLFFMELKTRRVHFAGCTPNPTEEWMQQTARELTNFEDGFLSGKRYLIMDRDPKFTGAFRTLLRGEGIKSLRLPSRSPNLNAHIERFFGSLKPECLDRLILFGEGSLRNAVREYLVHYHTERNHQGLDNRLIIPFERPLDPEAPIETTERLGGLLRSYRRAA